MLQSVLLEGTFLIVTDVVKADATLTASSGSEVVKGGREGEGEEDSVCALRFLLPSEECGNPCWEQRGTALCGCWGRVETPHPLPAAMDSPGFSCPEML